VYLEGKGLRVVANVDDQRQVDTFRRSPIRVIGELVLTPVGGLGFLAFAAFLFGQVSTNPVAIVFVALAGFFGLLLLSAVPALLRRGLGTTLLQVGPNGIWHRDIGSLAWDELAEVRLERNIGAAGGEGAALASYHRLGIVPRDAARVAGLSGGLSRNMAGAFIRFANGQARSRGVRRGMTEIEETAPLGVYAYELDGSFETLLDSVRRFMPVRERADSRPPVPVPPIASSRIGGPVPEVTLLDLDRRLAPNTVPTGEARGDPATEETLEDLVGRSTHEEVAASPSPEATFSLPAVKPLEVVLGVVSTLALLPALTLLVPLVQRPGLGGGIWVVIVGILLVAVGVPWFRQVLRMLGRLRERPGSAERLRVGPEGLWLQGMDTRSWDSVREIRTERAGSVRRMGGQSVERWQLVIVPETSAAKRHEFRVASDELDARFDDVLDLIRRYHPVDTG
jgi:hypothetical protein